MLKTKDGGHRLFENDPQTARIVSEMLLDLERHGIDAVYGKTALVTGAATDLGQGIAVALAERGARVVVSDMPECSLAETVALVHERTRQETPTVAIDVREPSQIDAGAAQLLDEFGRVDILVNSTGINRPAPGLEVDLANWEDHYQTNMRGRFLLAQKFAPAMIGAKWGRVIRISSQSGSVGIPGQPVYCSTKGAVVQLVRTLGVEWAKHGITVNSVASTFVDTREGVYPFAGARNATHGVALQSLAGFKRVSEHGTIADQHRRVHLRADNSLTLCLEDEGWLAALVWVGFLDEYPSVPWNVEGLAAGRWSFSRPGAGSWTVVHPNLPAVTTTVPRIELWLLEELFALRPVVGPRDGCLVARCAVGPAVEVERGQHRIGPVAQRGGDVPDFLARGRQQPGSVAQGQADRAVVQAGRPGDIAQGDDMGRIFHDAGEGRGKLATKPQTLAGNLSSAFNRLNVTVTCPAGWLRYGVADHVERSYTSSDTTASTFSWSR